MTPPFVEQTLPADDSVRVGLDSRIHIRFSEAMDHRSVERAVFISPQPSDDPDFRWKNHTLEIRLPGGLRSERTYVVTVGQESADEWRNKMVASYSFGFATGDALNLGELSGRVLRSKEQGQVFVWGYDLALTANPDPGRDRPAYVTQPDADGQFLFRRLGPGRYRVFAFVDGDRDRSYTAGLDALAVPASDVTLQEADRMRLGNLQVAVRDTSGPRLTATRTPDARHVLLRFDEAVRIGGQPEVAGLDVLAIYQDPMDSSRVGLLTSPQRDATYRVRVAAMDRFGNRTAVDEPVQGDSGKDRRPPEVLMQIPSMDALSVAATAPLTLVFSDAMRQESVMNFWLASDSTGVPEGVFTWTAANRLLFVPKTPWPPGQTVRLVGRGHALADAAGNVSEADVRFVFAVRDTGAWGQIVGSVTAADAPQIIRAQALDRDEIWSQTVSAGDTSFAFDRLAVGTYRLDGFLDVDGDGRWFSGAVLPFAPAEPLVMAADTVEVRARWTTESRLLDIKSWWPMPPESEENLP